MSHEIMIAQYLIMIAQCESDCTISQNWVFTSNFVALYVIMVHAIKRWYTILKFPKNYVNWDINTPLGYKFGLKINFIRVWPWKFVKLGYILGYTTHFGVHALGTNLVENNGIMRDYDVIKCESDCAISQKIFFSQFRVKIECSCSNGSNEPRILKFPKN